jgi:hypothetical protein
MSLVPSHATTKSRAYSHNPGKHKIISTLDGVCASCRERYRKGTLIVATYEHERCGPTPEIPAVLAGLVHRPEDLE